MRRALILAAALGTAALPSAAVATPSHVPAKPPPPCDAQLFADQIGTPGRDALTAPDRPERLWGLAGDDTLTGSPTRAACLFGGRGDDHLDLAAGGGVIWAEDGDDMLVGSPLMDRLHGGDGRDAFAAGAQDDVLDARDGNAEVVDCGAGTDRATADRADLLLGCEKTAIAGRPTPMLTTQPRAAARSTIVRVSYRVPLAARAGAYRILLTTGAPRELTRFPMPGRRVRARQRVRIGLRPPAEGWGKGLERAVIVLYRAGGATPEPVARLRFSAG